MGGSGGGVYQGEGGVRGGDAVFGGPAGAGDVDDLFQDSEFRGVQGGRGGGNPIPEGADLFQ